MLQALAPHAGSEQEAMALSHRLGGLPLALHHAGSYLASPFTPEHSFAAYRTALDKRFAQMLGGNSDSRSVVTTAWEISLDALAIGGKPQARPLLRVLSCFEPSVGISATFLDHGILATACAGTGPVDVRGGLEALLSLGLLETRHESGSDVQSVVIHPLVADASRLHLEGIVTTAAANLLQTATVRLEYATPRDWPAWLAILPHLRSMLRLPSNTITHEGLTALAHAAARTCFALSWSGAHVASGELTRTAQAAATALGGNHEAILALRYQSAISSRYRGRYREAESELREVLEQQRSILGSENPATLATQQEAARVMANLGRYAESEIACREILAARLRVLGPNDLETLVTRHYLARAVGEQGRYEESATADAGLLEMSRQVVGDEHYFTLLIRKDLAAHLNNQGRCVQAEHDLRALLQDWLEMPDNDYTYVLDARYELGRAITGQRRYQEAGDYLGELLQDELRVRGPDHPHTLLTRRLIAEGLDAQGQHGQAESDFRDILERQARTLGPGHPRALMTRSRLARAVAAQGRFDEAAHLYRDTYLQLAETVGTNHPETQAVSQALAELLK